SPAARSSRVALISAARVRRFWLVRPVCSYPLDMPTTWYYSAAYGHHSTIITNHYQAGRRGRAVLVRRWRDVHDEGHRSSDERLGHAFRGPHAARQDDAASPASHLRGGDLRS